MGGNINLNQTTFAGVLSALVIDADKDFGGFNITNLGAGGHNLNTKLGYLDQDVKIAASPTFVGLTLSGLTQGSVLFAGAGGVISQDNSNLFWDNVNNRLGIGTANPRSPLDIYADNQKGIIIRRNTNVGIDVGDYQQLLLQVHETYYGGAIRLMTTGATPMILNPKMSFYLQNNGTYLLADMVERMTILSNGNVGIGTASPQAKHDIHGNSFIGDYSGGNYAEVKSDGEINLHGTARVDRHWLIDPTRFKLPGANYPAESFEGLFYTLDFDKSTDESAYCEEHVPYRWDSSTDIEVEVWWLHDSVDAGVAVWGIEYLSIKEDETVGAAGTTITQASAGNHTAGELQKTTFSTKILHANLEAHDIMAIRLFRDADNGSDTLNEDARVINVCFHFIMNKLGQAT